MSNIASLVAFALRSRGFVKQERSMQRDAGLAPHQLCGPTQAPVLDKANRSSNVPNGTRAGALSSASTMRQWDHLESNSLATVELPIRWFGWHHVATMHSTSTCAPAAREATPTAPRAG